MPVGCAKHTGITEKLSTQVGRHGSEQGEIVAMDHLMFAVIT